MSPPPSRGGPGGGAEDAPPEVPLTPVGWLVQNGIYLAIIVAIVVWLVRTFGWEGLPYAALTVFGIGFLIFIHELGHFLVAKWCDVHVVTFSIGFGPAIPGCSFKRGETTYKLSLLPLGGYVNMVGEGPESDEGEDYPRSFKNKSVGQRMAIISAGVIMNLLLGAACFVFVLRTHGIERTHGVVWSVDSGSPAWRAGLRPGMEFVHLGGRPDPSFDQMAEKVRLSGKDEVIAIGFRDPAAGGEVIEKQLRPRRGENAPWPTVGIIGPHRLELLSRRQVPKRAAPVMQNTAAAAARATDLRPGDVVLATTDPDNPERMKDLTHNLEDRTWDYAEFGRRLRALAGKPMVLLVARAGEGGAEPVELSPKGFDWQDRIIGTTAVPEPSEGDTFDPLRVDPLPVNPRDPAGEYRDPFVFRERMRALAGKLAVIQVRRHGASAAEGPVNLLVPPAFHRVAGLRMEMGKVAAVRDGSPADEAGVRPWDRAGDRGGDVLVAVLMTGAQGRVLFAAGEAPLGEELHQTVPFSTLTPRPLDPVRLPHQLAEAASAHPGKERVILTVLRPDPETRNEKGRHRLPPMRWDDSWSLEADMTLSPFSPLSVPHLGLAYWVHSKIDGVRPDSPAAQARREEDGDDRLRPGDLIAEFRYQQPEAEPGKWEWGAWNDLASQRGSEMVYDEWASVFATFQNLSFFDVQFRVSRGGEVVEDPFTVTLIEDESWPLAKRGLLLEQDKYLYRTDDTLEALELGMEETWRFITSIYVGLKRVATGRVSSKTFGGPIMIVSATFTLARENIYALIFFLGIISINLAVVNFLPIPLLDGGHMVFLIYEKLRGKPPSDQVRAVANIIGLALLLALMGYVIVLDIMRL